MLNIILSLVLGAGLDSLYYYLYISKIKGIKNKRVLLYSLIFIGEQTHRTATPTFIGLNPILNSNLTLFKNYDIIISEIDYSISTL